MSGAQSLGFSQYRQPYTLLLPIGGVILIELTRSVNFPGQRFVRELVGTTTVSCTSNAASDATRGRSICHDRITHLRSGRPAMRHLAMTVNELIRCPARDSLRKLTV